MQGLDINTNVLGTAEACAELVSLAELMRQGKEEFSSAIRGLLEQWETTSSAKEDCVIAIDQCDQSYEKVIADIRALASTVNTSAENLQALDRNIAARFA
jgi:hypothetical protein